MGSNGAGDGPLNPGPVVVQIDGSDVYVGGSFTNVNHNGTVLPAADYIAKWDTLTGTWSALGSNGSANGSLNQAVYTLGMVGDKLYAGGRFTNVNNNGTVLNTADYIAAYGIGDGVYRVAPTGVSTSTCGHNWANPCDLQYVLSSLATSGDEIWVKAGTYKPTTSTDRTIFFIPKNGVAIYGGFAGTETLRMQRDPLTNVTILSGDLNGDDNANISYNEPSRADNVFHVVVVGASGNVGADTILAGVTITGGNANFDGFNDHTQRGGGMWYGGSPTLNNVIVTDNSSLQWGGGMYAVTSNSNLTDVTFANNASDIGGGLYVDQGSPTLVRVNFTNNKASWAGGGVANYLNSNSISREVTFSGNTASIGGAMANYYNSNLQISESTFYNNHAYYTSSDSGQGAGIHNNNSSPLIENTSFSENIADRGGSAVANVSSNPTLINVTIANNFDGIWNTASHPIIRNSIIWGNYPYQGAIATVYDDVNSSTAIYDSVIENGFSGGTNIITVDPMLEPLGNYGGNTQTIRLMSGSSAIDAGDDVNCPATDQRGVTRPQGSHCDIGAYEFMNTPSGTLTSWNNTFNWMGVSGATWYLVQVQAADDSVVLQKWYTADAAGCSDDLSCVVSPEETLTLANGDYKWRLLDYGDYGYGSWTPYTNFNLNAACYALTTDVLPAESGTINTSSQNCSGGYIAGTVVQLTAVPNSGHAFASWSGDTTGIVNPISITIDANKSVTANLTSLGASLIAPAGEQTSWNNTFSWTGVNGAAWYLVQVQTNNDTVMLQKWYTADVAGCAGDLSCAVSPAETLDLSNGDYKWRILDYGDYGYGSWTPYTNFNLNAACYTLTMDVLPIGSGAINASTQNCSGGYMSGTVVQLTALPNSGYTFASWSGNAAGTSNPVSITMDAHKSITANLTALGATLIAPVGEQTSWNNSFTWTGVNEATWYLVQAQTNDDTVILQKWYTADAAGCSGDLSCVVSPEETLNLANGDYKWRILDYGDYGYGSWTPYTNFSLNAVCYTLTTNVLPSGSGMVTTSEQNCSGGYLSGTMVQMTALSNSGYVFASWSGNAAGTSNPVSIIMDANKNVTANMMSLGTTLIAPSSALTSWDNTFSWIGITGATWYLVQAQAADDTVILQQWYTADAAGCAGDLSCAVSPAETLTLANSDYKWRILDYGDYGYGSWSPYTTFSLNQ